MGTIVALAVLGFALGDSKASDAKGNRTDALTGHWTRIASPSGLYSLEMPDGAKTDSISMDLPNGQSMSAPALEVLTDEANNFGVIVLELDYAGKGVDALSLRGGAEGFFTGTKGVMDEFTPTPSALGDAASFAGRIDGVGGRVRGYAVTKGLRMLIAYVIVPTKDSAVADTTIFRIVLSLKAA